jgi:hypothetical protein
MPGEKGNNTVPVYDSKKYEITGQKNLINYVRNFLGKETIPDFRLPL